MSGNREDSSKVDRSHQALIAAARDQAEQFRRGSSSGAPLAGALDGLMNRLESRKYHLIREIHRGGQGVVYLAEQMVPHRQVAVKMVREGPLATPGNQLRFQREIELLGSLSHPNIVSIHDSGGEEGCLYYVMDYVDGPSLDEYVRSRRVKAFASSSRRQTLRFLRETLQLFKKVCDAVQAAHLRGIIHRDLKPSNIRVDARGEPRVLDFGLAKIAPTEGRGNEPSLSETGQFLGTLTYASPEQADGANTDLDLRTDVYSLGVILYRLLTGRAPYDAGESARTLIDAIIHKEPTRPTSIVPEMAGDIETILLTALQKKPERRYQTAGAFADDIHHYLAAEPIDAKRDSAWYVVRKNLMRHRLPVAAAMMILALILVGSVVSLVLWRAGVRERQRAQLEAQKATAISDFLHQMLASASPFQKPGEPTQVQEVLHTAQLRLDAGAFHQQPEVEAGLKNTLGMSYLALGRADAAVQLLTSALEIREKMVPPNHSELAISYLNLGHADFDAGDYDGAVRHLNAALTTLETVEEPEPTATRMAEAEYWLGRVEQNRGRTAEAGLRIERAMALLGESDETPLRAYCLDALGVVEAQLGHLKKSLALAHQAVALRRAAVGEHPDLISSLTQLGNALTNNGDYKEAYTIYAEATALSRKLLGRHPVLGDCLTRETISLIRLGRYEEALDLSNECLPILREFLGDDDIRTCSMLAISANALRHLGRLEEAAHVHLQCIAINRRLNRSMNVGAGLVSYAQYMQQLNRLDEAETSLGEAVEVFRNIQLGGKPTPSLAVALTNLASVLFEQGRASEGEANAMEALDLMGEGSRNAGTEFAATKSVLAKCLMAREAWAQAEKFLLEGIQDIDRVTAPPADRAAYHRRLHQNLVELYREWNKVAPVNSHEVELHRVQEQLAEIETQSNPTASD